MILDTYPNGQGEQVSEALCERTVAGDLAANVADHPAKPDVQELQLPPGALELVGVVRGKCVAVIGIADKALNQADIARLCSRQECGSLGGCWAGPVSSGARITSLVALMIAALRPSGCCLGRGVPSPAQRYHLAAIGSDGTVAAPRVYQFPAFVEQVAAPIGALDRSADRVGEAQFRDLSRKGGAFRGEIAKARPKPVRGHTVPTHPPQDLL
jgi:hypothetical protein